MKTIANCTPVEFLRQTNKMRHLAEDLLHTTGIKEIRKRAPALTGTETEEEKRKKIKEQADKNFDAILDALLDDYAEDTVALLGLMCFMDAEQVASSDMPTLLEPVLELLHNQSVRTFFTSLLR